MKRLRQSIQIAVACTLALTVVAFAAEAGGGGAPGGGPRGMPFAGGMGGGQFINKVFLAGVDKVAQEIKITDEQKAKITEISTAYRKEQQTLFAGPGGGGRNMTPEEREKARAEREKMQPERQKKMAELLKTTEAKLDAVLQKDQVTRLNEITLQQQGVDGLVSERIVKELKLTDDQVKKLKEIITARDKERQAQFAGRGGPGGGGDPAAGGTREERQKKMEEFRKTTETTAVAVLTKDQQAAYTKLKGKPFELDRATLMRGFGGPGGGRRGGGGGGGGGGAGGGGGRT
jgi:hypothetical protein